MFGLVRVAQLVNRTLLSSEELYKLRFVPGFERARWRLGEWKAWWIYELARRRVPAYREFAAGLPRAFATDFAALPEMDKHSYVKAFPLEAQCLNGEIPREGVVVDESSGTSGKPNNWVRGPDERRAVKKMLNVALHELLGREPLFVINAFALGPWATGMNVSSSVVDMAILKSTGPELEKIEATLRDFGPRYRYLVTGYPPFLKTLVDRADVDWERYEIYGAVGGEGISEAMRDYLGRAFRKVYGSYGASDLEINIAAENDFTIALRRELARDAELRAALTWPDEQLPMVFQYSPLDYYLETNGDGELIVTLLRPTNVSPRVRYNIHDRGQRPAVPRAQEPARRARTLPGRARRWVAYRSPAALPLRASGSDRGLFRLQGDPGRRRGGGLLDPRACRPRRFVRARRGRGRERRQAADGRAGARARQGRAIGCGAAPTAVPRPAEGAQPGLPRGRAVHPARRRADAGAPPGGLRPLRCQRHQAEEAVHPARVVQALA